MTNNADLDLHCLLRQGMSCSAREVKKKEKWNKNLDSSRCLLHNFQTLIEVAVFEKKKMFYNLIVLTVQNIHGAYLFWVYTVCNDQYIATLSNKNYIPKTINIPTP